MNIFFGEDAFAHLSVLTNNYDKFFLLTDENIFRIYSSMIASLLPEKKIEKIEEIIVEKKKRGRKPKLDK